MNVSLLEKLEDAAYDWVERRPEYVRLAAASDIEKITFQRGVLGATDFGRQFFRAVS